MVKLVENSYRDINIAYANELSILSKKFNVDVCELIKLSNMHPRVNIHTPGAGVGGHCLPIDPWFIVSSFPDDSNIIKTSRKVNIHKERWVADEILRTASTNSINNITLLGLTYKPDIDDFRQSPALNILDSLIVNSDLHILCVDPFISKLSNLRSMKSQCEYSTHCKYRHNTLFVVLTLHKVFNEFLSDLYSNCKKELILDFSYSQLNNLKAIK